MKTKAILRRTEDQIIADLEAQIEHLKVRAATKAAKKDPAFRHVAKAIRAIDAAAAATGDSAMRGALQEARATLSACLQLGGIAVSPNGRSAARSIDADAVLAFVRSNPGQRGEHIAAALGIDSKTLRSPMKRLIEAGQVRTKGNRRGMQYFAG